MINIYCDGSSTGKVGPGGWAYVIVGLETDDVLQKGSGGDLKTTNNQMELTGAIEGLAKLAEIGLFEAQYTLVSDSMYCLGIANGTYNAKKNVELAKRLRSLYLKFTNIQTKWVKGHSGDFYNDMCDKRAKYERYKMEGLKK